MLVSRSVVLMLFSGDGTAARVSLREFWSPSVIETRELTTSTRPASSPDSVSLRRWLVVSPLSSTSSSSSLSSLVATPSPMPSHQDRLSSSPRPVRLFRGLLAFFGVRLLTDAISTAVMTLAIVYKGAPSLGLKNLGSAGTAAAVVGSAAVVALLSILFWVPFVYCKVARKDYSEFAPLFRRSALVLTISPLASPPLLPLLPRTGSLVAQGPCGRC